MTEGEKQHGQSEDDSEEGCFHHEILRFPRHPALTRLNFSGSPLDGSEPRVAKEVVDECPGSYPLVTFGYGGVPARHDVLYSERVAFVNAHGERCGPAEDALRSILLGGTESAEVVLASRHIEHGFVTEDQAGRKKPLRRPAVMVVAFLDGVDDAPRAVSDSTKRRALEGNRTSEPPLAGGSEGKGRAGDPEDLRRDIVEAPVQAPH